MAVLKVRCPECGATLRIPGPVAEGKRIRCAKCGVALAVPEELAEQEEDEDEVVPVRVGRRKPPRDEEDDEDDEEYEDRPRRPRKRGKKSAVSGGLLLGLLIGGGVLILACAGIGVYFLMDARFDANNPRVNRENWERLNSCSTLQEVEALLGPGRKVSQSDLPGIFVIPGVTKRMEWRNGNKAIYCGFDSQYRKQLATNNTSTSQW